MTLKITEAESAEIQRKLSQKSWRLRNLYYITDEKGRKVPFRPNPAQLKLLQDLHFRNVILKARQLGFTTFIQIFMLDAALFSSNVRCGVIAHNREDAQVFFRDKIKFAYDNLPDWVRPFVPTPTKNEAGELMLANGSSVRVGTSMRSGTLQYLHISEYGKICRQYPLKAKEVKTGALPALHEGSFLFVESTAEGREGDFYNMCTNTRALNDQKKSAGKPLLKMDNKFHFFPWHEDLRYQTDPEGVVIDQKMAKYFAELKIKHGILLTPGQMAWYVMKSKEQGEDMKQEYPSTPDEAFEQSIEGAYYSTQMMALRNNDRIREVPWEPILPVNVFWDLGMNDEMVLWFHQRVGRENRLIDYYANSGEGFEHYARVLKERDYMYGTHFMPHDINVRDLSANGKTRKQVAEGLGIKPIKRVPRPRNLDEVLAGIDAVRQFLTSCWIDDVNCVEGIKALDQYRKEWDEKLGTWKKGPLHNWASHGSDALRTGAIGFRDLVDYTAEELMPEAVEDY